MCRARGESASRVVFLNLGDVLEAAWQPLLCREAWGTSFWAALLQQMCVRTSVFFWNPSGQPRPDLGLGVFVFMLHRRLRPSPLTRATA